MNPTMRLQEGWAYCIAARAWIAAPVYGFGALATSPRWGLLGSNGQRSLEEFGSPRGTATPSRRYSPGKSLAANRVGGAGRLKRTLARGSWKRARLNETGGIIQRLERDWSMHLWPTPTAMKSGHSGSSGSAQKIVGSSAMACVSASGIERWTY